MHSMTQKKLRGHSCSCKYKRLHAEVNIGQNSDAFRK